MAQLVNKLDINRSQVLTSLSEISQTSKDNSVQLQNIHDLESQQKNTLKVHLNQVYYKLEQHMQDVAKSPSPNQHEHQIKSMDCKIKQIDRKLSQVTRVSVLKMHFHHFQKIW